jgi:transcriptional regulator with XRE-family HTH domain
MNTTRFRPDRLRRARAQLGDRSITTVAAAANVTEQTVRNWEAGKSEPDASQLAAIAKLTGKSLDFFFGGRAA